MAEEKVVGERLSVWIVNPYGELPSEGWSTYRTFLLAEALSERGHEVHCFISSFNHRLKEPRSVDEGYESPCGKIKTTVVPTSGYTSHTSISRVSSEMRFGRAFRSISASMSAPDIVVLADPCIFYGWSVVKAPILRKAKLIIDVLDLWPEMFVSLLHPKLSFMGESLFMPLKLWRSFLHSHAKAIVGVSSDYVAAVKPRATQAAEVFYIGSNTSPIPLEGPAARVLQRPMTSRKYELTLIYAGTLGSKYDIELLIEAARLFTASERSVGFVICGDGPKASLFDSALIPSNVHFLGRVNQKVLLELYQEADIGVMPYCWGSEVSMPLKLYDYLNHGLPVISSLRRESRQIIEQGSCGLYYEAESLSDFSARIEEYLYSRTKLNAHAARAKDVAGRFDCLLQHQRYAKFLECLP